MSTTYESIAISHTQINSILPFLLVFGRPNSHIMSSIPHHHHHPNVMSLTHFTSFTPPYFPLISPLAFPNKVHYSVQQSSCVPLSNLLSFLTRLLALPCPPKPSRSFLMRTCTLRNRKTVVQLLTILPPINSNRIKNRAGNGR